ncbi:MAG: sugar transferase [Oscillospiraceae bacterium]|nr:sugar transferase [Oscillospiraceae bacterium]
MLTSYDELPPPMRNEAVRKYCELLSKKRASLFIKRAFDLLMSALMLIVLFPLMLGIALYVKCDSRGPVFFKQLRVTKDMRDFSIYKFRSMVADAPLLGGALTLEGDSRITKSGAFLRKTRLDELPQLINILKGEMSFVGTRPEVREYVEHYSEEMLATLLLPAGVTSRASIEFIEEAELLKNSQNASEVYVSEILPRKMRYNLDYLENFSLKEDIMIMLATVGAVSSRGA